MLNKTISKIKVKNNCKVVMKLYNLNNSIKYKSSRAKMPIKSNNELIKITKKIYHLRIKHEALKIYRWIIKDNKTIWLNKCKKIKII